MIRTILVLLVACLLVVVGFAGSSGHTEATPEKSVAVNPPAEEKPLPIEGTRAAQYPRLAIVCAPGTGADPQYVPMVLKEIAARVSKYLSGLQKVNIIPDASVDSSTGSPTVRFKTMNDYDAVAVITYTYSPLVLMDINLIDVKTGQNLLFLQLHADADDIGLRLYKLAHLVPQRINKYFYRKG